MVRIGLINWYQRDKVWVNILRNVLFPVWFDFRYHIVDFNLVPIIALVVLYFCLK